MLAVRSSLTFGINREIYLKHFAILAIFFNICNILQYFVIKEVTRGGCLYEWLDAEVPGTTLRLLLPQSH